MAPSYLRQKGWLLLRVALLTVSESLDWKHASNIPGRRVAGAGPVVAGSGVGDPEVGIDFFDDVDMVDNVLSSFELLRESFLRNLSIVLCCEKRFKDDSEAGLHEDVSYRKGIAVFYETDKVLCCKCLDWPSKEAGAV